MSKNPRRILIVWCREQNICPWKGGYCSRSCSWLDCYGNVVLCFEHGNPRGFLTRKRVSPSVLRGVS